MRYTETRVKNKLYSMVQFFMEMPTPILSKVAPQKNTPEAPSFRDQRRDRIVQVAREVFYEVGYAGASMSMISTRLGGSKATLYAYFNSKEELFDAIIREQCTDFAAFAAMYMDSTDFRQTLRDLGRQLLTTVTASRTIRTIQLIIEESHRNPVLAQMFNAAMETMGKSGLLGILQNAHDKGHINAPDAEEAARVWKSLLFGDSHFKRLLNLAPVLTEAQLGRQVDLAVDIFMTYYGRKADPSA